MEHDDFEDSHQPDEKSLKAFDSIPTASPNACLKGHYVDCEVWMKPMLQIKQTNDSTLMRCLVFGETAIKAKAIDSITKRADKTRLVLISSQRQASQTVAASPIHKRIGSICRLPPYFRLK